MYEDKTLQCRECGQEFIFSAGEQEFYQQKGLVNAPGRCPSCRQRRRQVMSGASRERTPREMHTIVCAECGADLNQPPDPTMTRPLGPVTNHAGSGSDQRTEAYAPAWNQSWSGNDPGGANQTGSTPSAPAVRTPVTPVAPTDSTTVSRSFSWSVSSSQVTAISKVVRLISLPCQQ